MLLKGFETPINIPVEQRWIKRLIGREIVPENGNDFSLLNQDHIGLLAMHLENDFVRVFQPNTQAPFIPEYINTGDWFHQHLAEQVNAVTPCPVKRCGKRKALQLRKETGFQKNGSCAVVELNDEFVFALTERGNEDEALKQAIKLDGKGAQEKEIVVHDLQGHGKAIVGQEDAGWQFRLDLFMKSHLVTYVRQVCLPGTDLLRHSYSLSEIKMGNMRFMLKGIQHEHLRALDALECIGGNAVGVGDVAKVTNAKTEYGHIQVFDGEGQNLNARGLEGLISDLNQVNPWDAGIPVWFKSVGELAFELFQQIPAAIHRHIDSLEKIVSPDIIQAGRMIFVPVGEKYTVKVRNALAKHLLSEIRACVDDEALVR